MKWLNVIVYLTLQTTEHTDRWFTSRPVEKTYYEHEFSHEIEIVEEIELDLDFSEAIQIEKLYDNYLHDFDEDETIEIEGYGYNKDGKFYFIDKSDLE